MLKCSLQLRTLSSRPTDQLQPRPGGAGLTLRLAHQHSALQQGAALHWTSCLTWPALSTPCSPVLHTIPRHRHVDPTLQVGGLVSATSSSVYSRLSSASRVSCTSSLSSSSQPPQVLLLRPPASTRARVMPATSILELSWSLKIRIFHFTKLKSISRALQSILFYL
jgi:hypothetical protein